MNGLPRIDEMSPELLAEVGAMELAYVRPIQHGSRRGYGIFSASGELMAIATSRAGAFLIIRQHELEPVDAH